MPRMLALSRSTLLLLTTIVALAPALRADTIHTSETINANTTWTLAGSPHIVVGSCTVSAGVTLTVQAGCELRLDNAAYMQIYGNLSAPGTVGSPILITRRDAGELWTGLYLQSTGSATLSYCTIEYAASGGAGYGLYGNTVMPTISNCTFRFNNYGLYLTGIANALLNQANTFTSNNTNAVYMTGCSAPTIANQTATGHDTAFRLVGCPNFHLGTGNAITGNTWALTIDASSYPAADCAGNVPVAGNTNNDGLAITGGNIAGAVTWREIDVPFILLTSIEISPGASLAIEPGVTVRFENSIYLQVYGTLNAPGTLALPILFTRRDASDAWTGLYLQSTGSATLSYCTIEYAASGGAGYGLYGNTVMPTISNCTFRFNNYGLYLTGIANALLNQANTFTSNNTNAVYMTGCSAPTIANQTATGHGTAFRLVGCPNFHLGTGNAITGNTWALTIDASSYPAADCAGNVPVAGNTNNDGLAITGGNIAGAVTWREIDVPFILLTSIEISPGASLAIEPGVTVRFENTIYLQVYGTLNAPGTLALPILFTRRDASDAWTGLYLQSTGSATLSYCTIEYAASGGAGYGLYGNTVMPTISNCTFRFNNYGLYLTGIANVLLNQANTFTSNNTNAVYMTGCSAPTIANQTATGHGTAFRLVGCPNFHLGTGNAITGNTWALTIDASSYPAADCAGNVPVAGNTNNDGLAITGGNIAGAVTWREIDVPFILLTSIEISPGASLAIEPGVTVRFENTIYLQVYGTLNAPGTLALPILFTRRDASDAWTGLYLQSTGSATLSYCTVEYAASGGAGYGIYANTSNPVLTNCTLRLNNYGVYANSASPQFKRCSITGNAQYGVYLTGACLPTFGSGLTEWNDINGNGGANPERDLRNGSENISARYVWWGVTTEAAIEGKIRHEPDDANLGLVLFSPWTEATHTTLYYGSSPAGEDGAPSLPTRYAFGEAFPNPFNPTTTLSYDLPRDSHVRLEVFDAAGRRVALLADEEQAAGSRTFLWQAGAQPAGVYFARLQAAEFTETRKLVLIK